MRILILFGLLSCAMFISVPGTAQARRAPFSITINTLSSSVKAGSDVWIAIQLTNTSGHDLAAPINERNGIDISYHYEVRDSTGSLVRRTARTHPEIDIGSVKSRLLKPGEAAAVEQARVSGIYDMSLPGQYSIQVTRIIADDPKETAVKSNKIIVTVTD